jgi:CRISPR-associated protein Cmr6
MIDKTEDIQINGADLIKMLNSCENPVLLCRMGLLNLAHQRRENAKKDLLERLIRCINDHFFEIRPVINDILCSWAEALKREYDIVIDVTASTKSRLLVHAKNDTTSLLFEIGTIIHPILGFPIIPGSSMKGALRSYLSGIKYENVEEILGGPSTSSSKIVITDAYPVDAGKKKLMEPDVITPIYKDPREHKASPVPIIYPVVAKGVKFRFFVALKEPKGSLREEVRKWVSEVIDEGIGGKTTVGYGILGIESLGGVI